VRVGWPLWERSVIASVLGLPGYAAIGIALGFTGLGVFIDLERINGLGTIFKGCYFTGCLVSVCWVKRRALFGPMVQPPLLLAIAVPGVVLAADGGAANSGLAARLLAIGTPLLNGFPTMAVTTAFVVCIGIVRYLVQRPDPEADGIRMDGPSATAPERSRPAASDRSRPSAPPRAPDRQRPSDQMRPVDPPRGREPQRSPDPARTPERRPSGPGRAQDPSSVPPTPGQGRPGPGEGRPPPPPRKSDLHRAQKRPT
jgi:hypothetical protein